MLVTPGDSLGLADAIEHLAASHELRRHMGEINRTASLPYDWSRLAERVREVYGSALEVRGRPPRGRARRASDGLRARA
jgi:hypothetical protein